MSNQRHKILVVDDETSVTCAMEMILSDRGYAVETADSAAEALVHLKDRPFNLAFIDLRLPDTTGIELLTQIKAESSHTQVILMTAHGSLDVTIEAIKRGAFYYLEKPFKPDQVLVLVERALRLQVLEREN